MAQRSIEMLLTMFLMVMTLWSVTMAQSDPNCANVIISLSPCLDYVTGKTSTPSSICCSQLASVVSSQPRCLCEIVNGGSMAASLNINQTVARALPATCNVQTPPINACNSSDSSSSPPSDVSNSDVPNSPSGSFQSTTGSGGSIHGSTSSYGVSSSEKSLQCSLLVMFIFANFIFTFITTT